MQLILASESPRRKQILSSLGLKFICIKHLYKEPKKLKKISHPAEFVSHLALKKAQSVVKKFPDSIIISADTIVVLGNEIIGKPKNEKEAEEILTKLSGTKHKVYTGLCILWKNENICLCDYDVSTVYTRRLSKQEIEILSKKHLDKAGAYAIQEKKDAFVKKIVGDYYNVVGFPVELFIKLLSKVIDSYLRQYKLV